MDTSTLRLLLEDYIIILEDEDFLDHRHRKYLATAKEELNKLEQNN